MRQVSRERPEALLPSKEGNQAILRSSTYLHASTETENEVQGRFLLDVVVRKGTSVLELLSGEDQTLLIRGDSLLFVDERTENNV